MCVCVSVLDVGFVKIIEARVIRFVNPFRVKYNEKKNNNKETIIIGVTRLQRASVLIANNINEK